MPWQDIVILVSQIIFAFALFPSLLSKDKPALATSIINTFFLLVISYANYTLNLYGAAIGIFICGLLWGTLAIQKYQLDRKKTK